jgi:anthranilate phosphoribosyltransferase
MRHVIGPRREIGLITIFNLLGPLTNPAGATVQVVGVYHPGLTVKIAEVLKRLGCRSALVVHGEGGLDEVSILGTSWIARLHGDRITTFRLAPEDVGFRRATLEEIRGGNASENAAITMGVLRGDRGAPRDMVLLNAAAALLAAGTASTFQEGLEMAEESIDSGNALRKLQGLVTLAKEANGRKPPTL